MTAVMVISVGSQIDRFEVQRLLGEGGLARVYLVKHRKLASLHAMKLLRLEGERLSRRFIQEGQVQARIRHPNVVSVTDVVELDDEVGLVMEYVEGTTLAEVLADGQPLPRKEIGPLFAEMCAGVIAAHHEGVLHRDLKPGNVLLSLRSGKVQAKIADFGIAKVLSEGKDTRSALTDANSMMGTPGYMAPEQLRDAKNVDVRADIFSLGCILYEMCCGHPPFLKMDKVATFSATLSGEHRRLQDRDPTLPPALCAAVECAIAVDPNRRFDTVQQLADAVAATIDDLVRSGAPRAPEVTMRTGRSHTMVPAPTEDDLDLDESSEEERSMASAVGAAMRASAPNAYWETDEARAPVLPRGRMLEPPKLLKGEKPRTPQRRSSEIIDFRRNRRFSPIDLLGPVVGLGAILAMVALLAHGSAATALQASHVVSAEASALGVPWAESTSDLSTLLPAAESPAQLLAQAEAFRTSTQAADRITRGHGLVRSLRAEITRQTKSNADSAAQARRLAILHQLDRIDASLEDFSVAVEEAKTHRTGWTYAIAEKVGWVGPDTDPELQVLAPLDPVLVMPEVVAQPTAKKKR